jgi:hypothetical protein
VAALRAALPGEPAIAVCASAECWLATAAAAGTIAYEDGAADAALRADDAGASVGEQLARVRARVLRPWGGTGVLAALSAAVARRCPLFVLPVTDAQACCSPGAAAHAGDATAADAAAEPPALRECVMLRPGSTLEEAFGALRRAGLADGELVRAERVALEPPPRRAAVLRKEEGALRESMLVLRIATSKRAPWQKKAQCGGGAPA